MTGGPGLSARPLRADALRNHRAIVAAAREAFEEAGPDVPLEEVARRAGVGPSTLYRRFAGRDDLVAAVFAEYVEEDVEPLLARAVADPDPGHGLAEAIDGMARSMVRRRGFLKLARDAGAFTPDLVTRAVSPLCDLLSRAQAAGRARADLEFRDVFAAALMLVATAAPFDEIEPDRWARYLTLLLDAFAPVAASTPLPPLEPVPEPPGPSPRATAAADTRPPAG